MGPDRTVRAVAVFEAAKGALVFLAGFGALSLLNHDAQRFAEQLIAHLHLNPASRYPRIFLDAAAHVTNSHLSQLATLAAAYGSIRFVEAYGLWREKRWAEWLAAISASIYIPFELHNVFRGDTGLALGALVVNVLVVGLMIYTLLREHPTEPINAA